MHIQPKFEILNHNEFVIMGIDYYTLYIDRCYMTLVLITELTQLKVLL